MTGDLHDTKYHTREVENARYYVSVMDAGRYAFLLGPFDTHEEALAHVDAANRKACEVDPRAHWYAFGTAKLKDQESYPDGVLNEFFTELFHEEKEGV